MRNERNKKPLILPHSKMMWAAVVIGFSVAALMAWMIVLIFESIFKDGFNVDEELGGLLFFVLLLGPASAFFCMLGYSAYQGRKDYLIFSSKGLEMSLHPELPLIYDTGLGLYEWEKMEACALREITGRYGIKTRVLLVKMKGEEKTLRFQLGSLHGSGKNVSELLKRYAPALYNYDLVQQEKDKNKDTIGDYFVCGMFFLGLIANIYSIDLYKETTMPSWYWVVVLSVCLIVAVLLRPMSKLKKFVHYLLAISVGMILCYVVLWIKVNLL